MPLKPVFQGLIFGAALIFVLGTFSLAIAIWATKDRTHQTSSTFQSKIEPENIKNYLRKFAEKPHIAGSDRDEVQLVNYIKDEWNEAGVDAIEEFKFKVKLSYPDKNEGKENYVILTKDNQELVSYKSYAREPNLPEDGIDMDSDDITNPFLAFTKGGDVDGYPIYVNFGRVEDFEHIGEKSKLSAPFNNESLICIMRYGKIFRGNKVENAENWGCVGSIIYNDPEQYAPDLMRVYTKGDYLPGFGTQRGTALVSDGDPETPGYPAWLENSQIDNSTIEPTNDNIFYDEERSNLLYPKSVAQPIGYEDAKKYMEQMNGENQIPIPEDWKGLMDNVQYSIGPGFSLGLSYKIKIHSGNYETRKEINTVCGYFYGVEEPDRYVVFGNHRDAWVYGAIDPNSGSATMMEVVRAFGDLKIKDRFKPRRTMMFCSLACEEYGLFGSYELVEALQHYLHERGVVYINMDYAVKGNQTFDARGSPHLKTVLMDVTSEITNPHHYSDELPSVLANWIDKSPDQLEGQTPIFKPVGSGSDFRPFAQIPGMANVDMRYKGDYYPLYHSQYETTFAVENFIDPGFKIHGAMAKIFGSVGFEFATKKILPFNLFNYGSQISFDCQQFMIDYGKILQDKAGIDTDMLSRKIEELSDVLSRFQNFVNNLNLDDLSELRVRSINDVLMNVDRMFLWPQGLPGREYEDKHLLYATFKYDTYVSTVFPTLRDGIYDLEKAESQENVNSIKQNFSILYMTVKQAIYTMEKSIELLA